MPDWTVLTPSPRVDVAAYALFVTGAAHQEIGLMADVKVYNGTQCWADRVCLSRAEARTSASVSIARTTQLTPEAAGIALLNLHAMVEVALREQKPPETGTPGSWFVEHPHETLIPFDPAWLMAPSLTAFVRESTRIMDMPLEFFVAPLLAVTGACIGAKRRIRITATFTEQTTIWSGIVGPPGTGKTPSIRQVTAPLHAMQAQWWKDYKAAKEDYEADLGIWESQPKGKKGPKPVPPIPQRILTSDPTLEALIPILQANPAGLLLERDELAGWMKSFNQYKKNGGADLESWLSIYSGAPFSVDRKGDGYSAYIAQPYVAVTGGIQPEKLMPLLTGMDDGFSDRLLLFWPETKAMELREIALPQTVMDGYTRLLERLRAIPFGIDEEGTRFAPTLRLTPAAFALFKQEHDALQAEAHNPDTPTRLRNSYAKYGGLAARLALLLHLACIYDREAPFDAVRAGTVLEGEIEEACVRAAWAIVACAKSHLRRIHGELATSMEDARAAKAVDWIERHGGTATVRDIVRSNVAGVSKASQAKALFENLADRHLGVISSQAIAGGERVTFTLPQSDDTPGVG